MSASRDRGADPRDAAPDPATAEQSGAASKKPARSTKYRKNLADAVCSLVRRGKTLREACRIVGLPKPTFLDWVAANHDGLSAGYARARDLLLEHWADEIVSIADDGSGDTWTDEEGREHVNHDHINRSRLRIDTRKWLLSKLRPEKYGDRVGVDVTGDRPPVLVIGLQQPRHDPLALPASSLESEPEDIDITESVLDVSQIVEAFRPRPKTGHDPAPA